MTVLLHIEKWKSNFDRWKLETDLIPSFVISGDSKPVSYGFRQQQKRTTVDQTAQAIPTDAYYTCHPS
jgi:hypothetical protein